MEMYMFIMRKLGMHNFIQHEDEVQMLTQDPYGMTPMGPTTRMIRKQGATLRMLELEYPPVCAVCNMSEHACKVLRNFPEHPCAEVPVTTNFVGNPDFAAISVDGIVRNADVMQE